MQGDAFTALDKRTDEARKQLGALVPQVATLEERAASAEEAAAQQRDELGQLVADMQASTAEALDASTKGATAHIERLSQENVLSAILPQSDHACTVQS